MGWKVISFVLIGVIVLASAFLVYYGVSQKNNSSTSQQSNQSSQNQNPDMGQALIPGQKVYTYNELLAIAAPYNASEGIPVGDGKYNVQKVEKGYIDYCSQPRTGGEAQGSAPWIQNGLWYPSEKPSVEGSVSWSNAVFTDIISGTMRILTGNGLPMGYPTGIFPISKTDPAHQYDGNPNSIEQHLVNLSIPLKPTYSNTPTCINVGEVGVMLSGIPIFDGMDADQRDAAAHEVQDLCDAHPQEAGIYHYHSLSACFTNISVNHVLGYALDGFPITGPEVAPGKYLNSSDLDECHGITSQITDENGNTYATYHYVMTYNFPYSISCFRGKPVTSGNPQAQSNSINQSSNQLPQPAIDACSAKSLGDSCSFTTPNGTVSGTCKEIQNELACAP